MFPLHAQFSCSLLQTWKRRRSVSGWSIEVQWWRDVVVESRWSHREMDPSIRGYNESCAPLGETAHRCKGTSGLNEGGGGHYSIMISSLDPGLPVTSVWPFWWLKMEIIHAISSPEKTAEEPELVTCCLDKLWLTCGVGVEQQEKRLFALLQTAESNFLKSGNICLSFRTSEEDTGHKKLKKKHYI